MNEQFNRPKSFGQILDHTFRLSKNRFTDFFMVLLILIGPIYLLQAFIQLLSGTSFFRSTTEGNNWFEQVFGSFEEVPASSSLGADLGTGLLGIVSLVLLPVAQAAILFAVNHIRKGESYTVTSIIKQAFSKFWSIFGSSLLMSMIGFGLLFIPFILIIMTIFAGAAVDPVFGIIFGILLFLGVMVGAGLFFTRLSFYLGAVVMENDVPGITRSWHLSRQRTWKLFGLYLIFTLIIASISTAVEFPIMFLLGNSVLYTIIINVVTLFTTMIFAVGYAVIFFDLKIRNDAEDLKGLIDEYDETK